MTVVDPLSPESLFPHMSRARAYFPEFDEYVPTRSFGDQLRYVTFDRWAMANQTHAIRKGIEVAFLKAQKRAAEAQEQDAVINASMDYWSTSGSMVGVRDPTGITYDRLATMVESCEPAACIINTRVNQVAAHAKKAQYRRAHAENPGFRIKLNVPKEQATKEDEYRIAELEQFIEETGYCEPPENEQPVGWEPGFDFFLKCLTRDTLTYDWVAVRRWQSSSDPRKYPIVSFAADDAASIRRVKKTVMGVQNHRLVVEDYEHERSNVKDGQIKYVRMDSEGGRKLDEYTTAQMFTRCRRPRTRKDVNGYGYSELEEAINCVTGWVSCRDYNLLRFNKDALPRGVLSILGQINGQQMAAFTDMWRQMFEGNGNRWKVPILQATPQTGSSVNWTPFDLSNREMEYGQFLFTIGVWLHAIYQIHPDETGFSAASPFRPPLSEASPDTQLQQSQDKGLQPLLVWIADTINKQIIWRMDPSRRYVFEFVGAGDWDEMQDTQTRSARLAAGLSTPRMEWNELDQTLPEDIKDHPAWDLPMPWAQGFQLIQGMQQSQQQQDMADQQQQHTQQMDIRKAGAAMSRPSGDDEDQAAGGGMDQEPEQEQDQDRSPWRAPKAPASVMTKSIAIDFRGRKRSRL